MVLAFDVYGTLVDYTALIQSLRTFAGNDAPSLSELWRQKQIEYAIRRALMGSYEDFTVCTRQAFEFAVARFDLRVSEQQKQQVLEHYKSLPAFSDARRGLELLADEGHDLVAFSNGTQQSMETVLSNAGLVDLFRMLVSVDEVRTFKPDPVVYQHLAERVEQPIERVWLVSGNPWDVIGAKSAGMKAAWVDRKLTKFDPWGVRPDIQVESIEQLARELRQVTA